MAKSPLKTHKPGHEEHVSINPKKPPVEPTSHLGGGSPIDKRSGFKMRSGNSPMFKEMGSFNWKDLFGKHKSSGVGHEAFRRKLVNFGLKKPLARWGGLVGAVKTGVGTAKVGLDILKSRFRGG